MDEQRGLAELMAVRRQKLAELREIGIDPYPSRSSRDTPAVRVVDEFEKLEGHRVTVAGRLMAFRRHGQVSFGRLQDESGQIQVMFRANHLCDESGSLSYSDLRLTDVGDHVQCSGQAVRSRKGEISVDVDRLVLLAKSLRPLPEKWSGLQDDETRIRLRHLDLLLDASRRDRLRRVSHMLYAIREFLHKNGFTEVLTPVLQPQYGGGRARPFTTDVWALRQEFFLAISHELYLKRMIMGGFEKVFTIGRYFRNEGIDRTHNPEFNMLETMSAYENYEDNMNLLESLYQHVALSVFGELQFESPFGEIDLTGPWRRVSMVSETASVTGISFAEIESAEQARAAARRLGVTTDAETVGHALVDTFEELVAPGLVQPTIVYGHPREISPLAKLQASDSRYAERFELFVGGIEQGDNWTELNDPDALRERFTDEQARAARGDKEAHAFDIDFVEAMEWGMPPTTGLGPGIERLAMLLTGSAHIADVMPFPLVRRRGGKMMEPNGD